MLNPPPSVVLQDVSFAWPDGTAALRGVSGAFGRGRTGLVGDNGVGKSTLLRLIAGELAPTAGTISATGAIGYLPQGITLDGGATVADVLGVRGVIDALRRLEAGDTTPAVFEAIGDDWDVEARCLAALSAVGLDIQSLDRPTGTLSGGETMLVGLLAVSLRATPIALLDEPTNNLDEDARSRVYDLVRGWRGALVVVSHDVRLLELMDDTAELRHTSLRSFGGPYSEYVRRIEKERDAARQQLRSAEQALKAAKRRRVEAEERIAHSERRARKDARNKKYVKAVIDDRRNAAEKAQGSRRGVHDDKVRVAQAARDSADRRTRDDESIAILLPDPEVPAGRRIAVLTGVDGREFVVQGPERIALTGRNGVGKTTLLRQLVCGEVARRGARAESLTARVAYLSQHLETLRAEETVLGNIRDRAPSVPLAELRNRLARLHLRGAMLERPVATLSGGERFRVALAQLLYADPPAQLLLLDEPTNNLDMSSVARLVDALKSYRGALLVVSHDRDFLERLDLTRELRLESGGVLWCTPRDLNPEPTD